MCSNLGDIIKRQRGDQYRFGINPNSDNFVLKKISNELLSDVSVTKTKSIDNFFGDLDWEHQKIGSIGLNKDTNDLNMKYSKDLIEPKFCLWSKKMFRNKIKEYIFWKKIQQRHQ